MRGNGFDLILRKAEELSLLGLRDAVNGAYTCSEGRSIVLRAKLCVELFLVLEALLCDRPEFLNWILVKAPHDLSSARVAACLSIRLAENIFSLDPWDVAAVARNTVHVGSVLLLGRERVVLALISVLGAVTGVAW